MRSIKLLVSSGLCIEGLYLVYRLWLTESGTTVIKYMVIYGLAFLLVILVFITLRKSPASKGLLITSLLFALLFQLTLLGAEPEMSDDIYRYLWDGKLQCFGINPFTYAPGDPALIAYHSDILPGLVNFPEIKTIYPPAAQLLFRFSYLVFGESIKGLKFLFVLFQLASICLFYLVAKERQSGAGWLFVFAWNPLVIMETAVNGHLDVVMAFFLLLCLYFYYKQKRVFSGVALALAILTKLVPIILVPLLFLYFLKREDRFKRIMKFFAPLGLTLVVLYLPYIETAYNMFLTALNYSSKWYFNNPLFHIFLTVTGDNGKAHVMAFVLFIVLYAVILFRPFALEEKIFLVFACFVICNPTIHPWYLILLLGLTAIGPNIAVLSWSGLIIFSYLVVYRFKITGIWQDNWLAMVLEYLPLGLLLIYQNRKKTLKSPLLG